MKAYSQDINQISKEQAIADIDSLVYTISEVHPEMFTVCKQGEFLKKGWKNNLFLATEVNKDQCHLSYVGRNKLRNHVRYDGFIEL